MWRHDGDRDLAEETIARTPKPPPATPAVEPGSLAWASAIGNHAVARMAAEHNEAAEETDEVEANEEARGEALAAEGAELEELPE